VAARARFRSVAYHAALSADARVGKSGTFMREDGSWWLRRFAFGMGIEPHRPRTTAVRRASRSAEEHRIVLPGTGREGPATAPGNPKLGDGVWPAGRRPHGPRRPVRKRSTASAWRTRQARRAVGWCEVTHLQAATAAQDSVRMPRFDLRQLRRLLDQIRSSGTRTVRHKSAVVR